MNANELADELKEYALDNGYSHIDYADSMNQAATMLRQQQAEIAELKAINQYQNTCMVEYLNQIVALKKAQEK